MNDAAGTGDGADGPFPLGCLIMAVRGEYYLFSGLIFIISGSLVY